MNRRLDELTWTELRDAPRRVLAVPLGSTEQHGPHLPLSTDSEIAAELTGRLAADRDDVVVAPTMPYGSSGEHAGFPGTISIGREALAQVLIEVIRSAKSSGFEGVVFVCGHGGNADPLRRVAEQMRQEGHDVLAFMPRWEGDAHAGRLETSMMLALRPASVRRESATVGNTTPLSELLPALRTDGVKAVSANGVLGDATGASAAEGEALLAAAAGQLIDAVKAWRS